MMKPNGCKTFGEYAQNVFIPFIENELKNVERADIIFDQYFQNSLKKSVREERARNSSGFKQRVIASSPIPANWENFLHVDENKSE